MTAAERPGVRWEAERHTAFVGGTHFRCPNGDLVVKRSDESGATLRLSPHSGTLRAFRLICMGKATSNTHVICRLSSLRYPIKLCP